MQATCTIIGCYSMKNVLNRYIYFFIALSVIGLDRITKMWALSLKGQLVVNSYLSFDLVYNRGISWGFFNSSDAFRFYLVTVLIMLVMVVLAWHARFRIQEHKAVIGEVLVLAGGLSNLFDRLYYKGVIDFIELSYHNFSWPIFNCADIAIVMGVGLMVYTVIRDI